MSGRRGGMWGNYWCPNLCGKRVDHTGLIGVYQCSECLTVFNKDQLMEMNTIKVKNKRGVSL